MQKTSVTLLTGDQMPLVGFGTWKVPKQNCPDIVYNALKAGYKLLDCACDYGNQHKVGEGIKKALDEGVITRKQLFVTSKLWNTFHRPEHVEAACRRSLTDLGLQYLDLYLIHFPISLKYVDPSVRYPPEWFYDPTSAKPCMIQDYVPIIETWKAMQQLVKKGLVRNIGVSNFRVSLLRDLINSSTIKPSVLQVQLHPHLTQKRLIKYCKLNKIAMTSYSSLGATSYLELKMAKQDECLTSNQTVNKIAKKQNKSAAQILLKWAVQQQIAIIPKTLKTERLKENSDMFGWELSEEEMKELDGLNKDRRYNDPGVFCELAFNTFFPIYE